MANEDLYQDEVETLADDEYAAHESPYQEHEPQDDWAQAEDENIAASPEPDQPLLDPLDQLPLELTLRCGALKLTLGELRRIGAGSIVQVTGIAPGHATLCHGERVVAEGELVDVDGRLGLQITRMATAQ